MDSDYMEKYEAQLACVKSPKWFKKGDVIGVDEDIKDAIIMLWENGIVTTGCCSGHGKTNPWVMVAFNPTGAVELLEQNDSRNWTVMMHEWVHYKTRR